MAVTNFIQSIWSKKIQDDLELKCKLVDNCARDYEGDCKYAQSVKILGVGEPTVRAYDNSKDIEIEEMSDRGQLLTIDQANYFAFYVDDVNQAQSVPGLREEYQRKAVHKLAVARDTYIASLAASAFSSNAGKGDKKCTKIGSVAEAIHYSELPPETFKKGIDEAIVALRERNFDEEGVIEISPAMYNLFKNYLITVSTDNPEYIKKGIVGVYDGFDVVMTNNLQEVSYDNGIWKVAMVRGKKAIAFAGQINEVEALRSEKKFKDIIRGLDTFGAKIIDPERIQLVGAFVSEE